jgi:hypothetical protein
MKNINNSRYILQVILHCQKVRASSNSSGYALLIASVLSILTFSMLSVFIFSTNLYKSVANANLESGSTFYAAETALNRRAYEVRQRFVGYERPTGISPNRTAVIGSNTIADQMKVCMGLEPGTLGSDDFACTTREIDYTAAVVDYDEQGRIVERAKGKKDTGGNLVDAKDNSNTAYRTYSFVKDVTNYAPAPAPPNTVDLARITDGAFTGLNAQEYVYRVYTTAAKEATMGVGVKKDLASQTMLQMDFKSRLIPIFQFAAFYQNDLEITSSSNMLLDGPVHTNSNLRLVPGGLLTLDGSVSSSGRIYKALEFTAWHGGAPQQIQVIGGSAVNMSAANAWINGSAGSVANETSSRITAAELLANNNILKENQPQLNLPTGGLLDRTGEYYEKADLVVHFDPLNGLVPLQKVRAMGADFTAEMLWSLGQPILAIPKEHGGDGKLSEYTRLCPKGDRTEGEPSNIAATQVPAKTADETNLVNAIQAVSQGQRDDIIAAMQRAMVDPTTPITDFSATLQPFSNIGAGNARSRFKAALPSLPVGLADAIADSNLNVVAEGVGGCYLPAPMHVLRDGINYPERREGRRQMNILQTNIKSFTVWNRDGKYLEAGSLLPSDRKLFARTVGVPVGGVLPANTATPNKAATTCDYVCMGLGATDQTNGGLVWHFSINKTMPGYDYASGNGLTRGGVSSFGFAFSGGTRLPGAMTLVSDQAIYVQGDFNNPSNAMGDIATDASTLDDNGNAISPLDVSQFDTTQPSREKKPASFLADTISILSNSCLDENKRLNCFVLNADNTFKDATPTVVRAAFLARTDKSTTDGAENSGGLNNYMRMMEDWGGQTFKYRGSFVSLGIPQEFSGLYRGGNGAGVGDPATTMTNGSFYNIPIRNFGFDADFNTQPGLPPLTPRAVFLKQKVFKRDYDRKDRNKYK